jgi:hypothetical protein
LGQVRSSEGERAESRPAEFPISVPAFKTRLTRTSTYRHCMRNEDGHENSCDH